MCTKSRDSSQEIRVGRNTAMRGRAGRCWAINYSSVGMGKETETQNGAPELKQTGRFNEKVPERK